MIQPNTDEIALMGELSAQALSVKGVRGAIIDGASRDVDFLVETEFPVFCRFATPRDVGGCWRAREIGGTIAFAGRTVNAGDFVLGDRDGVVVIPASQVEAVIAKTERVAAAESDMRAAIAAGMDPLAAFDKFGMF